MDYYGNLNSNLKMLNMSKFEPTSSIIIEEELFGLPKKTINAILNDDQNTAFNNAGLERVKPVVVILQEMVRNKLALKLLVIPKYPPKITYLTITTNYLFFNTTKIYPILKKYSTSTKMIVTLSSFNQDIDGERYKNDKIFDLNGNPPKYLFDIAIDKSNSSTDMLFFDKFLNNLDVDELIKNLPNFELKNDENNWNLIKYCKNNLYSSINSIYNYFIKLDNVKIKLSNSSFIYSSKDL